jgi:alpha-D-xyloside xylohydrolase
MPIIRPMILAFQNDPAAAAHRYQYMFGPDLLVAPMYQPGTHRGVYLPKLPGSGEWLDYWTGNSFAGGQTIEVKAPLDRMPLFVRAGAIIPMLPEEIDTLIPRHAAMSKEVVAIDDRRVLQVWPGADTIMSPISRIPAGTTRADGKTRLQLISKDPRTVEVWRRADATAAVQGDETWTRDPTGQWWCKPVVIGPEPIVVTWDIDE